MFKTVYVFTKSSFWRLVIGDNSIKNTPLCTAFNPLKGRGVNWLHFAIQV